MAEHLDDLGGVVVFADQEARRMLVVEVDQALLEDLEVVQVRCHFVQEEMAKAVVSQLRMLVVVGRAFDRVVRRRGMVGRGVRSLEDPGRREVVLVQRVVVATGC